MSKVRATTYEVVVYDDVTCAVTVFNRNGDSGQLSYEGREFLDEEKTKSILDTLPAWMKSLSMYKVN